MSMTTTAALQARPTNAPRPVSFTRARPDPDDDDAVAAAVKVLAGVLRKHGPITGLGPVLTAYLQLMHRDAVHEQVGMLACDARGRMLCYKVLFNGTLNQCRIYPRELVREAFGLRADRILVVHWTTQLAQPGDAQQRCARAVRAACEMAGVKLLDYCIVTPASAFALLHGDDAPSGPGFAQLDSDAVALVEQAQRIVASRRVPPGPRLPDPGAVQDLLRRRGVPARRQLVAIWTDYDHHKLGETVLWDEADADPTMVDRRAVVGALQYGAWASSSCCSSRCTSDTSGSSCPRGSTTWLESAASGVCWTCTCWTASSATGWSLCHWYTGNPPAGWRCHPAVPLSFANARCRPSDQSLAGHAPIVQLHVVDPINQANRPACADRFAWFYS